MGMITSDPKTKSQEIVQNMIESILIKIRIVMIVLRQKSYGFLSSIFGGSSSDVDAYDDKYDQLIETNYKWALNYISNIDSQINKVREKLRKIDKNEELIGEIYIENIGNEEYAKTAFLADFSYQSKHWVGDIRKMYIKYDGETNKLYLREGYPLAAYTDHSKDKIIFEIKNKSDLIKACRMHFSEMLSTLNKFSSIDKFIEYLVGEDEEYIDVIGGEKLVKDYYNELKKFLTSIRL